MLISDWSSDVCSSDLVGTDLEDHRLHPGHVQLQVARLAVFTVLVGGVGCQRQQEQGAEDQGLFAHGSFLGGFVRRRRPAAGPPPGGAVAQSASSRLRRSWIAPKIINAPTTAPIQICGVARLASWPAGDRLAMISCMPCSPVPWRSEEHTSELQSLMRIS